MLRKIIQIDEEKCNGCGICADACHEGAIAIIDGKAKLTRDDYCDGFGDCLPGCPTGAISFIEKDTLPYDEAAVLENMKKKEAAKKAAEAAKLQAAAPANKKAFNEAEAKAAFSGCPGSRIASFNRRKPEERTVCASPAAAAAPASQLGQWPCQIKLVPVNAPYFAGAKLLIAADCTAFSYANVHQEFMAGRITLIGCPKLDSVNYAEKLTQILANNDIEEVLILRMEVPCCGGLEMAAATAVAQSGKSIPWRVVVITIDGQIQ